MRGQTEKRRPGHAIENQQILSGNGEHVADVDKLDGFARHNQQEGARRQRDRGHRCAAGRDAKPDRKIPVAAKRIDKPRDRP